MIMKKLYFSFAFLFFLTSSWAQKTELKLNLNVDETYIQKTESTMSIAQNVQGMEMDIDMNLTGELSYLVKSFQDGVYDMEVQYKSMEMNMVMPQGNEMNIKSGDESNPMSKIFTNFCNVPFNLKMTQYGRIQEISGFDKIYEKVFEELPGMSSQQLAQMKDQVSGTFGEESLRSNLEMTIAIYPNQKVDEGDTWNVESELTSVMNVNVNSKYTYMGSDEANHKITGNATLSSNPDAFEMNGMSVKSDLNGSIKSDILVDKTTGWVYEAKISQVIEGATIMEGNPQMPEGMRIPMKIKSEMVFSGQ